MAIVCTIFFVIVVRFLDNIMVILIAFISLPPKCVNETGLIYLIACKENCHPT